MGDTIDSIECQRQKYGEITPDLFDDIGTFFVDDDDTFIFVVEDGNIALDHIQMSASFNMTGHSVLFPVTNGTVLIVDSEIDDGYDIGYNVHACTVALNERLYGDNESIARFFMGCNSFDFGDEFPIENVMSSGTLSFADHFSASMMVLRPQSFSYYPGMSQKFNYSVTDRLGNVIGDGLVQNTTITLSTASFSGLLWFDSNGYCQICEEGVWFSDISLDDHVGDEYALQFSMDNDRLVLVQDEITLNIIGCPSGYGADSDNFTCSICDADTYNLGNSSLRQCLSCDPSNNPGILCYL